MVPKETRVQLLEMKGQVPFEQGLYHNKSYEDLVRKLLGFRKKFRWTNQLFA